MSRRLEDPILLTSALVLLSGLEMFSDRLSEASRLLEEGTEIAASSGDRTYLLRAALDQAIMEDLRGNHVRSLERNADALALAKQLGDEQAARIARHNTAYTLLLMGRPVEAEAQMRPLIPDYVVAVNSLELLAVAEDYAAMLVAVHEEAQAAVLLGAAQGLRTQFGIPIAVYQEGTVEDAMNSIRRAIGAQSWERAYQAGIRTDLADALTTAASAQENNAQRG
jgi:hypothetical protein